VRACVCVRVCASVWTAGGGEDGMGVNNLGAQNNGLAFIKMKIIP
jgi:hypothetical protein